jgi:hypothetical protein
MRGERPAARYWTAKHQRMKGKKGEAKERESTSRSPYLHIFQPLGLVENICLQLTYIYKLTLQTTCI